MKTVKAEMQGSTRKNRIYKEFTVMENMTDVADVFSYYFGIDIFNAENPIFSRDNCDYRYTTNNIFYLSLKPFQYWDFTVDISDLEMLHDRFFNFYYTEDRIFIGDCDAGKIQCPRYCFDNLLPFYEDEQGV